MPKANPNHTTTISYAYPSSPLGGRNGCYIAETIETGKRVKFDSEHVAIMAAVERGDRVVASYGRPSRLAQRYRALGVVHALDGIIAA